VSESTDTRKQPGPDPQPEGEGFVEVYVSPEEMPEVARQLLDAAGEERVERVETISGGFRVPRDIADAAGVSPFDDTAVDPARTGSQAARESSGRVVSGDEVIAGEIESGAASPAAVGAVFASNSPTGEDLTGGGQPEDETQAEDGQPPEPDAQPEVETQGEGEEQPELPQPEQEQEQSEAEQLRGDDLDRALRQAGLPLSGTAREKRARLAQANRNR
jgi:hypothetical protein